ncbi:DTW domain-containing protein [Limnobaculum zhutongyuii]|uniref:tRNA-uridine aminocarboxypropyltransferase n=1 Tax=Limnobaculum zhutongyuii TaxID=2498113 RepID=A0A411WPA0_9GAMM|nr:tRNA-uridine aminocarboxypropyltransferase [Limnobaculum zhutongyuii]QBH98083.1 DTW domain-containing protein [Limnobaculum zhutongyuii]TQS88059.1 DTW domain-containing protein [Limnobaculum zhutongyuii]
MASDIASPSLPDNAVLQLREQRLAQSTRPFRARGCRVIRCHRCLLPRVHCLCHSFSATLAESTFCLLMYDTEPLKPSNTGRLIADILPDTKAFLWSRTNIDPQLLALLSSTDYQPYVIFPAAYASPDRVVTHVEKQSNKRPLFIILDGTWTEARKMFRKSPYLDRFPVLSIDNDQSSGYQLREASRKEQLCTAEVAIQILHQTGDSHASEDLEHYFTDFRQRYLAGKANRSLESFIAFSAGESDKS